MATKSLLLSCLLMGFGAAQHPASEGIPSHNGPFPTAASSLAGFASSAAGSAISTTTSSGPGHEATNLPPDYPQTEYCDPWALALLLSTNSDLAAGTFCFCSLHANRYWLKPGMHEECIDARMEAAEDYFEWCAEDGPYPDIAQFICTNFEAQLRECKVRSHVEGCQHLSQVLKRFGSPYWDKWGDNFLNDKSSSSISPGDQSETFHRRQDLWAVVSKLTDQDTLEQRDAEESYHPVLKSVYEDCDALEDPELQVECFMKEIQRAMCEQNPWIPGCEDVRSDGDDDVPFNPAASDNKEDSSHSQRQGTATPQKFATESLVDWDDLTPHTKEIIQECRQAPDFYALLRCMEKIREICSKNPADELCQIVLERSSQ